MPKLELAGGREVNYSLRKSAYHKLRPTLVVVNGTFNTLENWEPLSVSCEEICDVLTYDLRNQGGSSRYADVYGFSEYVDDLACVLDSLGIDNTILMGYSSGSSTALEFALRHPDRTSGLILAAPLVNPYNAARTRLFHLSLLESLEKGGTEALFLQAYPLIYGSLYCARNRGSFIAFRERFISLFRRQELAVIMKVWLQWSCDVDRLRGLAVPACMLTGSEDPFNSMSAVRQLGAEFPALDVGIFDDCGHVIHIEQPVKFHNAVSDAVKSFHLHAIGEGS